MTKRSCYEDESFSKKRKKKRKREMREKGVRRRAPSIQTPPGLRYLRLYTRGRSLRGKKEKKERKERRENTFVEPLIGNMDFHRAPPRSFLQSEGERKKKKRKTPLFVSERRRGERLRMKGGKR